MIFFWWGEISYMYLSNIIRLLHNRLNRLLHSRFYCALKLPSSQPRNYGNKQSKNVEITKKKL